MLRDKCVCVALMVGVLLSAGQVMAGDNLAELTGDGDFYIGARGSILVFRRDDFEYGTVALDSNDDGGGIVLGTEDFAGPADPLLDALPNAQLFALRGVDHFATPKDFGFIDAVLGWLG